MLDESQPGAKIGRGRIKIRVQRIKTSAATDGSTGNLPDGVIGSLKATQFVRDVQPGDNQFHFRLTY